MHFVRSDLMGQKSDLKKKKKKKPLISEIFRTLSLKPRADSLGEPKERHTLQLFRVPGFEI